MTAIKGERSLNLPAVLAEFGFSPSSTRVQPGPSGFSGARVWRVQSETQSFALKAWPAGQPVHLSLAEIHVHMAKARGAGLTFVPQVLTTRVGSTLISQPPHTFDLATWQPGGPASSHDITTARLRAALFSLSQLHAVWKTGPQRRTICFAVQQQYQRLSEWTPKEFATLAEQVQSLPIIYTQSLHLLTTQRESAMKRLQPWLHRKLPLHLCLGDIWSDHILFTGDQVTGMVDYGNMRFDHPAQDFARLVGSYCLGNSDLRSIAYDAYYPGSDELFELASLLENTGRIVSIGNWLRWLVLERRTFMDPQRAEERFAHLVNSTDSQRRQDRFKQECEKLER